MSNRNYDSSALITIMRAQSSANYYNRQTTVVQKVSTTPAQVEIQSNNPQTVNYDVDATTNIRAGQQVYYFKNSPLTTVIAPVKYQ
jgi:hypothetical protein